MDLYKSSTTGSDTASSVSETDSYRVVSGVDLPVLPVLLEILVLVDDGAQAETRPEIERTNKAIGAEVFILFY